MWSGFEPRASSRDERWKWQTNAPQFLYILFKLCQPFASTEGKKRVNLTTVWLQLRSLKTKFLYFSSMPMDEVDEPRVRRWLWQGNYRRICPQVFGLHLPQPVPDEGPSGGHEADGHGQWRASDLPNVWPQNRFRLLEVRSADRRGLLWLRSSTLLPEWVSFHSFGGLCFGKGLFTLGTYSAACSMWHVADLHVAEDLEKVSNYL